VDAGSDPGATVTVVERGEDRLALRYRSASASLVRVAVPYFPGWSARLDGAALSLITLDAAFIGVAVPPGEGTIELSYTPRFFWPGAASSLVALCASLVALTRGYTHRDRSSFRKA
jgi:uncharacterized membrane protein YfhO